MAADLYASIDNFDGLIRSYFGIGNVYSIKGDLIKSCIAYDKSNEYFNRMIQLHPGAKMNILTGFRDFPDMLSKFKAKDGCQQ